MKTTTKSVIKEWITIILIAFAFGIALHFGSNTAQLIWPTPPVKFQVEVTE
jgi:hypothetical protein